MARTDFEKPDHIYSALNPTVRLWALIALVFSACGFWSCNSTDGDVYTVTIKLDSSRVGKFDSMRVEIYNGEAPAPGGSVKPVQVATLPVSSTTREITIELSGKVHKDFSIVVTGFDETGIAYRKLHNVEGYASPDSTAPSILLVTRIVAQDLDLGVGETRKPTLSFTPNDAADKRILFRSLDSTVAKVAGDSLDAIEGLKTGQTTITATTADTAIKVAFTVTVQNRVIRVKGIVGGALRGLVGDTLDADLTWNPADANEKGITLRSLDSTIVRVSGERLVTQRLGKAEVEATTSDGDFKDTFEVSVERPVFATDVRPITTIKCAPCHVPGTALNFQDSLTLLLNGSKALDRLESPPGDPNKMPVNNAPNGDLSPRQLAVMLEWLNARIVRLKGASVATDSVKLGAAKDPVIVWDPVNATNKSFTLTSLDSDFVVISGAQLVGKAVGQAQVQLRTLEKDLLVTFLVKVVPIHVDSVSIADTTATVGDTIVPDIHFHPSNATTQTYSLTKLRPASTITSLLPSKRIVATALGKDTLIATSTDGAKVDQFVVTVGPVKPTKVSGPDTNGTTAGVLVVPRLVWVPANTTDKGYSLVIAPADTAIAAVRSATQLQGKAVGTVNVTVVSAADSTVKGVIKFTVGPVPVVSFTAAPITTYPAMTLNPVLTWNPANATNKAFTLTSLDTSKVKIVLNQAATVKLGAATVRVISTDSGKTTPWSITIIRTPFTTGIKPSIVTHCGACHNSSDAPTNWQDSATAVLNRAEMLRRTGLPAGDPERMPPTGTVPSADLSIIRTWLSQE